MAAGELLDVPLLARSHCAVVQAGKSTGAQQMTPTNADRELAAQILRLTFGPDVAQAAQLIAEARAEERRDAERWRKLRDEGASVLFFGYKEKKWCEISTAHGDFSGNTLDEAIDQLLAERRAE